MMHRLVRPVIDGAVKDVMAQHPDYLSEKGKRYFARSLAKRLCGQLLAREFVKRLARAMARGPS